MKSKSGETPRPSTFDQETVHDLFGSKQQPDHNTKWAQLEEGDAALAAAALVKAEEIRIAEIDPGNAYLQGIADFRALLTRQNLIDQFVDLDLSLLPTTPEKDS